MRESLGYNLGAKYVTGVYFAPKPSIEKIESSLQLFSADAAHLSWGPYTLYSLYGRNANMGAFCLAHAILAGNEDKRSWSSFFQFALEHYPCLNQSTTTIISDRDKGLLHAIDLVLPCASGFYCSMHRSDNIGKFGKQAKAVYLEAVRAKTMEELNRIKNRKIAHLQQSARNAIYSVIDELQFPIARIVTGAKMYGKSTNGMSEAMNSANRPARVRGLDIFNSFGKLIDLEKRRFDENQMKARARTHRLSEYARLKFVENEEQSVNCDIESTDENSSVVLCIATQKAYNVVFPSRERGPGNLYASCSCGYTEVNYFPCKHAIAAARERGFADYEIVPEEYQTRNLRSQYNSSLNFRSVSLFQAKSMEKDSSFRLPPDIPRKRGRPQKRRLLSATERFKRRRTYLCSKCRGKDHIARNCTNQVSESIV